MPTNYNPILTLQKHLGLSSAEIAEKLGITEEEYLSIKEAVEKNEYKVNIIHNGEVRLNVL